MTNALTAIVTATRSDLSVALTLRIGTEDEVFILRDEYTMRNRRCSRSLQQPVARSTCFSDGLHPCIFFAQRNFAVNLSLTKLRNYVGHST